MMKLLFVYKYCTTGGVESALHQRIKALKEDFPEIEVSCLFFYDFGGRAFMESIVPTYITSQPQKIASFIKQKHIDTIVHIDTPEIFSILDKYALQISVFTEIHSSYDHILKGAGYILHSKNLHTFVPSRAMKDQLNIFFPSATISVLPNGIDSTSYTYTKDHSVTTLPTFLWIGRLDKEKNWEQYITSMEEYQKRFPNSANFLLIGGYAAATKTKAALQQHITRAELGTVFTWYPFVPPEEMPKYYSLVANSGGALISTSEFESFGMIILEAQSCRCPVIASSIPAHREIIEDRVNGLLCAPQDTNGYVEHMRTIIMHPEKRKSIVQKAHSSAVSQFDIRKITHMFVDYVQKYST